MKSPQRICVIAEGQLGDLLILSPALRSIKETFPSAALTVLVIQRRSYEETGSAVAPVFVENPAGGTSAVLRSDPHVDRVAEVDREALRALRGFRRLKAEFSVVRFTGEDVERFPDLTQSHPGSETSVRSGFLELVAK